MDNPSEPNLDNQSDRAKAMDASSATEFGSVAVEAAEHNTSEENLVDVLDLEASYHTQLDALIRGGIVHELSSGEEGIVGIDGKEYPKPSLNVIKRLVSQKQESLRPEVEQGYSQLVLVPFAADYSILHKAYEKSVIEHIEQGTAVDSEGTKILPPYDKRIQVPSKLEAGLYSLEDNVDKTPPEDWKNFIASLKKNTIPDTTLSGHDREKVLYYSKQGKFTYYLWDQNKTPNVSSKEEMLNSGVSPIPGWQLMLLKDEPETQEQKKLVKKRFFTYELEPSADEHLELLRVADREGLTPETWVMYALTAIEKNNVIIDYRRRCLLAGSAVSLPRKNLYSVPIVGWQKWGASRDEGKIMQYSVDFITEQIVNTGTRAVVRIA